MIAAALLLVLGAGQAGAVHAPPPLPTDWAALPALRYATRPELSASLDAFVRGEVAARRCELPRAGVPAASLRIDLALLVDGGAVVRIVPRAIGCPTVEQFAAGLLSRIVRGGLDPATRDGWYRATLEAA